jgi:hypothetical protein
MSEVEASVAVIEGPLASCCVGREQATIPEAVHGLLPVQFASSEPMTVNGKDSAVNSRSGGKANAPIALSHSVVDVTNQFHAFSFSV